MPVIPAVTSLYVANPLSRAGLATLFATHRPIAERVRRLRGYDEGAAVGYPARPSRGAQRSLISRERRLAHRVRLRDAADPVGGTHGDGGRRRPLPRAVGRP
jgi:hypothetical protein